MLQRLQTDKEAEVRDAARVSKEEVDKTERENRREDHRDSKEDVEDAEREKCEQAMLDIAKETDKTERRSKLRNLLKSERDKGLADIHTVNVRQMKTPLKNKVGCPSLPKIAVANRTPDNKVAAMGSSSLSSHRRRL
ncbi:hypothetical protein STCU_10208 [Strigomonas culicis]|uniref:Uncharacterized protein n=1 Tax=Strigomonas culicis TaxID=28005 RepID=S9V5C1_9TRYP|nr:hypothetical protein STCU_10208 [Strigomonas culicis]|eukprot:EPY18070.1 hypothetical protein STCU_10208 [Strigomonas culicis]